MVQFHPVPIYILLPILIMKSINPLPPLEELQALFIYNPTTGELTNKKTGLTYSETSHPKNRYLRAAIDRRSYSVQRIIYKLMTGKDPNGVVDHINDNKKDNRWVNLQCIPAAINVFKAHRSKGYRFRQDQQVWRVEFNWLGNRIHLGQFKEESDAAAVVKAWRDEHLPDDVVWSVA